MDRTGATMLAARLRQAGQTAEPVQVNPHTGSGDTGWAARVETPRGPVDVIGGSASGYQITSRTLGWQPFDKMLTELAEAEPDEVSPPADDDLLERLTAVAVAVADVGTELRAIRDELTLRARR